MLGLQRMELAWGANAGTMSVDGNYVSVVEVRGGCLGSAYWISEDWNNGSLAL